MKVSLNWLKEFLDLTQSPEEISDALTLAGLEAEGMETVGDDVILEIGLTPNLGHCMSIFGMVRELSAILNLPIKRREILFEESSEKIEDLIELNLKDSLQCAKYCARIVKNVKVGPSPSWLVQKLEKAGLRSVNHVVDVGNFVMLEMGQPLHMFDYDQLQGPLTIRSAEDDGVMTTLDEIERTIPSGSLLICDEKRPIAFAGVMGELTTSVSEKTQNVLIEAAVFTPEAVRKTSKQLNLRTDSSLRFERGIDPLAVEAALDMAASLLEGEIVNGISEAIAHEYTPHIVEMSPYQANRLLGLTLSPSEMSELLKRLEIQILHESEDVIRAQVPSYRNDLKAEIDLIEEVGRMFGFNNIPRAIPRHASSTMSHAPLFLFEEEIRGKLVAQGLQECLTCDLISPKQVALTAEKDPISVLHPASVDQSVLRPSLLPGLLEVVQYNLDHQNLRVAGFEVGHIHLRNADNFVVEPTGAIILTGESAPYHFDPKPKEVDFFELKGHVDNLLDSIGLQEAKYTPSHVHSFHPGRQAYLILDGQIAGILGEIHPEHLRDLGIGQRVLFAELNLHTLYDLKKKHPRVSSYSLMPGSERDWTISLQESTPIGMVLEILKECDSPILEKVFLLDLYKSEKIGKDRKNVTFRFQYRDPKQTISNEKVEIEHKRLTQLVAEKLENHVP